MAFAGIAALMAGNGIEASTAKLPGIVMIVAGAFAFAIGTIASKRFPMELPLMTSSALQIGIGCVPVALAGLLFEHPRFAALSTAGWALMAYMTVIGYCVSYFSWFAALERLPASVATPMAEGPGSCTGPGHGTRSEEAAARQRPADLSALAEGDLQRARQLYQHDQRPRGRRRRVGGGVAAAAAGRPNRDLRGFVARGGRLVPREMAAAEAWKRRQARQ